jgi:hypothetical protein
MDSDWPVVATVTIIGVEVLVSGALVGDRLQVAPCGAPEQVKDTIVEVRPAIRFTFDCDTVGDDASRVNEAGWPAVTEDVLEEPGATPRLISDSLSSVPVPCNEALCGEL